MRDSECLLLLEFKVGVVADMPAFAEMLYDPMLTFGQGVKADLKPLLHKISQVIVDNHLRCWSKNSRLL